MRVGCIRIVLKYLTGYEDYYRRVESVLGWCSNILQGKKIIIDAFRVY